MKHSHWLIAILVSAGWVFGPGTQCRHAQVAPPGLFGGGGAESRGAYSPYLNMLRSGSSPTLNYYGLTRPELNFQDSLSGLQQQSSINRQSSSSSQSGPLTTGHPAAFLNLGHYFQSRSGGQGGGNSNTNPGQATVGMQGQGTQNQGIYGRSPFSTSSGLFGSGMSGMGGTGGRR